eukprot:4948952-Amphidinium_carterae.1
MVDALKRNDFKTMAAVNHCVSSHPGNNDDGPFAEFVKRVLGSDPSERVMSSMRQLYAEAQATMIAAQIAELRHRLEPSFGVQPRQVLHCEATSRLESQQSRLPGIEL